MTNWETLDVLFIRLDLMVGLEPEKPSSSSVAPTCCLHRPSVGYSEADESFLSITDIVIDVVHSLVMVVVLWYVNVHLCPPPFVTLTVSFAHSVDLLKKTREAFIRCEAQFTGPVFISIIQSNPLSDQ